MLHVHVTSAPDQEGKQAFDLFWLDEGGMFRPELSKPGKEPAGYRRGQCYRAVLDDFVKEQKHGVTVWPTEQEAIAAAWVPMTPEQRTKAINELTYRRDNTGIYGSAREALVSALAWLEGGVW